MAITGEIQPNRILEDDICRKFPFIVYDRFNPITDPTAYFLIEDRYDGIPSDEDVRAIVPSDTLSNLKGIQSLGEMMGRLNVLVSRLLNEWQPTNPLFIFPGGGGRRCAEYLDPDMKSGTPTVCVDVSRIKDSSTGKRIPTMAADHASLYQNMLRDQRPDVIIVVDDAVNSGSTLTYLQSLGNDVGAKWIAATPVLFSPYSEGFPRVGACGLPGYDALLASDMFHGPCNPIQLNFASSLARKRQSLTPSST